MNFPVISKSKPRILLVGEYMWPWYQEVCAASLESEGCAVERFGWFDDFRHWQSGFSEPFYRSIWHRIQYGLNSGPTVWRVQRRLLQRAISFSPEYIWFYNVQLISPSVVRALKKALPKARLVQFTNDNPFSESAKPRIWKNYINSIPLFDCHYSYRLSNIEDYKRLGSRAAYLLRSYFIPEEDFPVPAEEIPERFKCDVVFAGHYEDDGRVEMLEAICAAGFSLNLFGGGWNAALAKLKPESPLRAKYPINPVTNSDYRYAICGAKVALCFLSTLNQDTYTRRNFQIPAMKVAMLSQHTNDLATLYKSNEEAVFFRSKQELLEKLTQMLDDCEWRRSLAEAGYAKVYAAGHDVQSRMRQFLGNLLKI